MCIKYFSGGKAQSREGEEPRESWVSEEMFGLARTLALPANV
jgi:hypothetical protein